MERTEIQDKRLFPIGPELVYDLVKVKNLSFSDPATTSIDQLTGTPTQKSKKIRHLFISFFIL